jgi:hypothetical protein
LLDLEKRYLKDGCLPPTLFLQVDGGAENANVDFLAMCELLVARGIISQKIVLTRLPVGHTHEDIDAIFALIWELVKNYCCLSPQQYRHIIKEAIKAKESYQEVFDIFAIPDYSRFLSPFRGYAHFGRAFKQDLTMHQFSFEKVDVSSTCPFGVEIKHRKYATDSYTAIIKIPPDEEGVDTFFTELGLMAKNITMDFCQGYNIIDRLPDERDQFYPEGFIEGSKAELDRVYRKIQSAYKHKPDVVELWTRFVESAPQDDLVENYISSYPLHIPFHKALFGDALVHDNAVPMLSRKRVLKSAPARDTVKRKGFISPVKTHQVKKKPSILKKG